MPRFLRASSRCHRVVPLVAASLFVGACDPPSPGPGSPEAVEAVRQAVIPATLAAGEAAFEADCAVCHGTRALGTDRGPPLVHIYYEPSHHADIAFYFAVERGVQAHHWRFGNMPALPHVSREQVEAIIAYVRFLQREAGIR